MRLPVIPTIVVGAAIAAMIALGIWQLQRKEWKEGMIARYHAAEQAPPVAWPAVPPSDGSLLYRHASGFCVEVTGWRAISGQNRAGEAGWSHIAACRTGGAEGPGMWADMGWSRASASPAWRGGEVRGIIAPDKEHILRLVATEAAPGLEPSAAPSPESVPNNHLFYAIQWFFFAAAAALIYALALRRKTRPAPRS